MARADRDLNMAIVRALGIPDAKNIVSLCLTLRPGRAPVVTVERLQPNGFSTQMLEELRLRSELPPLDLTRLADGHDEGAAHGEG